MLLEECFEVGYILKPHGLHGAVNIYMDVDDPSKYTEMESVFVKFGEDLVPFFVTSIHISGRKGIMSLQDVSSKQEAEKFKSCPILLPLDLLPTLDENQFYYHDIIGHIIVDNDEGELGIVDYVFTGGNQDLISMKYKGKEIMIPVSDEIVMGANHNKKEVYVSLPKGLLEIYL